MENTSTESQGSIASHNKNFYDIKAAISIVYKNGVCKKAFELSACLHEENSRISDYGTGIVFFIDDCCKLDISFLNLKENSNTEKLKAVVVEASQFFVSNNYKTYFKVYADITGIVFTFTDATGCILKEFEYKGDCSSLILRWDDFFHEIFHEMMMVSVPGEFDRTEMYRFQS